MLNPFAFGGKARFLTPDQSLLINGIVNTITTSRPSPITADGIGIGGTAGSPAVLNWTPGAVDNDVTLATADYQIKAAVAAVDNQSLWNIPGWTLQNLAATAGQADPDGGNNAYKVIATTGVGAQQRRMFKDATAPPGAANSSGEIWVSPIGNLLPILRFYPLNWYAESKPATREAYGQQAGGNYQGSIAVVETRVVGGRTWYRLWARAEQGNTLSTLFMDMLDAFAGGPVDVAAGEHGFYLYHPRYVSGPLPFYSYQRLMVRQTAAAAGVDRWIYSGPYEDTGADYYLKVLKPDSYDPNRATPYPVVYVMGVEPFPNVLADELQVIKAAGYHNTYDCIFASFTSSTNAYPWGGVKNDGSHNHAAIIDSMPSRLALYYNISTARADSYLLGYSKGGWAAVSRLLQNNQFGVAATWDVPWTGDYASLIIAGTDLAFGNEATFLLFQPNAIADDYKANVNDQTRIVLSNGDTWTAQYAGFKATLDAQGIGYTDLGVIHGTHDATATWMGPVLAAMFAL
jgi:hypothetical protein